MNYSYRKIFQQSGCKFYFLFVGFNPPEDIFFLLLFIRERESQKKGEDRESNVNVRENYQLAASTQALMGY